MRTLISAICILLIAAVALAQVPPSPPPGPRAAPPPPVGGPAAKTSEEASPMVSLDLKDERIKGALVALFQQSSFKYVASDDITDKLGSVTLKLDNVPFDEALNKLAEAAQPKLAVAKVEGRVANQISGSSRGEGRPAYMIGLADHSAAGRPEINLQLQDGGLDTGVYQVFRGTGYAYYCHLLRNRTVTVNLKNATFLQALDALTKPIDMHYTKIGEAGYVIEQAPDPATTPNSPRGPGVSADLQGVPIKEALNTLFQNVRDEYIASQDITDELGSVTLKLDNVPFPEALAELAEASSPRLAVSNIGSASYHPSSFGPVTSYTYMIGLADGAAVRRSGISLTLDNVPITEAIQRLFLGSGYAYRLDQSAYGRYSQPKVSVNVKNASFVQALDALLRPLNLKYRKAGEAGYIIEQSPGGGVVGGYPRSAAEQPARNWITMSLPPMPVEQALDKIDPGWTFDGKLGQTKTPAITFHSFPQSAAAVYVLFSAGLVPPADGSKVVKAKGKTDLEAAFRSLGSESDVFVMSGYPVRLAARRSLGPGGPWLYTLFADQSTAGYLLNPIFAVTGQSYVLGVPPTKQTLTARLYELPLDRLLDNLLPVLGMQYRKTGPAGKQTYLVSPRTKQ